MGDHLPNLLTLARIALTPVFVAAFWLDMPGGRWVAFVLFVIAAVTDYADGWIARRRNVVSRLGAMLDPIADKLLIASALLMLVYMDDIRGFVIIPALIILSREILVSGMREFLATISVQIPVSSISKFKTVVQVIAIAMLILAPAIEHVWGWVHRAGIVALWGAAVLTIYTGFSYVRANVAHVAGEDLRRREATRVS
ncbi:MAG: CDP-diacylglycerol--glycerol-3-phosphate 3-phosphatidyltransferase [Alphaproteobacteria bacterium]|nr:CDP-diacylglycerol--glycerol-3-phosphate 3-phosphatidyltransferase [Alphaproteobacteria bacterium]